MTPQPGFLPHVARLGQGPRPVLGLHCTMAFSGAWGGFMKGLWADVTMVAPDMPSHGGSPDWDEISDFPDTVCAAALSCLSEPMDVIGHSFGGATALRLAVEHPELVRSVTLIEPVFFHIALLDRPEAMAEHDNIAREFMTLLQQGEREEAARAFNRMWSDGVRWPHLPESVRAAMTRAIHVVPNTTDLLYEDTLGLTPRLGDVDLPVLLLRGETSPSVIDATNSGLARRLPNAREAVVADAGHMAPITHAAEVARLWSDFVTDVET